MNRPATVLKYSILGIFSLISIFPFYWMIVTALSKREWVNNPMIFPIPPSFEALKVVIRDFPFLRLFLNSLLVSLADSVGSIVIASFTAFSFACLSWKYRDIIFYVLLATMFLPGYLMIIPQFLIVVKAGLINTYWAIFLPSWFSIFCVFLLRQYFFSLGHSVLEAARIDGASLWIIYLKVALPHAKMVLLTLFIISFLGQWNAFFWPLLVIKSARIRTLAVGMAGMGGVLNVRYNEVMAASILSLLPIFILFVFLSKHIAEGLKMRINF